MKKSPRSFEYLALPDGDIVVIQNAKLSAAARALAYAWTEIEETPQHVDRLVEMINRLFDQVVAMSDKAP